jgi:hypothetical protein
MPWTARAVCDSGGRYLVTGCRPRAVSTWQRLPGRGRESIVSIDTKGRVSELWTSQNEARVIVAEYGCRLCGWKFPGEIYDVSGDLWCGHCVAEAMGLRPGTSDDRLIGGLRPASIPAA